MKRLLVLSGCLLGIAAPAAAQEQPADTAAVHMVRPGDTLWELARQYLENPYLWPEIFQLNRDVVSNPDWIYPAERLRIPGLVVQPRGVMAVAEAPADARTVFYPVAEDEAQGGFEATVGARLSAVRPGDFYRAGVLVADEEIRGVGRLAEVVSPSVVALETPRAIQLNDRVFMTIEGAMPPAVGEQLQLVRRDRAVGEYGRIFVSTGLATVEAVEGAVATVRIDAMHAAISPGDQAIPIEAFPVVAGATAEAAGGLEGRILAFQEPHAAQVVEDLAFLDVGAEHGVREGDEFLVIQPRTAAPWGVRPEIEIARLQVVRVSRRTAAARVVTMEQPALEAGLPVRLTARIP